MPLSDLYDDLDAYLADEPPEGEPDDSPLLLDGQESADRALRRLARIDTEAARVKQVADAERERIAAWEEDRLHGLQSRREWLLSGLEGFMRALHAQGQRTSLSLPWGRLGLKQGAVSTHVLEREDDVARGLSGRFVRTKYEVAKAEVKAACHPGERLDRLAEPGYEYRAVLDEEGKVLPGVAFLCPMEGAAGLQFTAKPNREGE